MQPSRNQCANGTQIESEYRYETWNQYSLVGLFFPKKKKVGKVTAIGSVV